MTSALIVIGVLALLIAGILLLRATVTIKYIDEFALTVRVLFLKFRILPAKERKIDPDDYSPRKFRRIIRKKEKKAEKRRRKAEKKAAKKAKKKAKAEEKAKRSGKVLVKKLCAVAYSVIGRNCSVCPYFKCQLIIVGYLADTCVLDCVIYF